MRDAMLRWEKTELKGISGKMDQISLVIAKESIRLNTVPRRLKQK
jgi:hypothetical protein